MAGAGGSVGCMMFLSVGVNVGDARVLLIQKWGFRWIWLSRKFVLFLS